MSLLFSVLCFFCCQQVMYTRLCLASLPGFVFRIWTVLSIQGTNWLDVSSILVYVHILFLWVHLTDNHTILVYTNYQSSCLFLTKFWDAVPTYWFANADAINVIWRMCSLRYKVPRPFPVRSSQYVWSQHGQPRRRRMEKTPGHRKDGVQQGEQCVRVARDNPNRLSISISSNHAEGLATTNVDLCRDLTRETLLVIASASFKANLVSLGQLCVLLEIEVHGRLGIFTGPRFWSDIALLLLMRFWPVLPARLLIS